jgi:tetratricopeptide (TPR) repeat protein
LALSVDGDNPGTLATAALISAFMVGDCESEIEMADRAVALNPNSYSAWTNRGWVYYVAGLPEEAVRSFERAIRMSPVDPGLHLTLVGMGVALIELGRFDEAIVAGKKAQRLNPLFRDLTAVSDPLSPISDVTLRHVRRRRVCLRSTPHSRYRRGLIGVGNRTRSC